MIEQSNRIDIMQGLVLIAIGNIVLWDITVHYPDILWLLIIVAGVVQVFMGAKSHFRGVKNE